MIIPKYFFDFSTQRIYNLFMQTRELILNGNNTSALVSTADTFFPRLIGLMGKAKIEQGLLITNCNSIHTFFMKAAIDAVFISEDNKVLEISFNLKPWKVVLPVSQAKTTLELPAGSATKMKIKKGDVITYR
jgi:hypothetical protein